MNRDSFPPGRQQRWGCGTTLTAGKMSEFVRGGDMLQRDKFWCRALSRALKDDNLEPRNKEGNKGTRRKRWWSLNSKLIFPKTPTHIGRTHTWAVQPFLWSVLNKSSPLSAHKCVFVRVCIKLG